MHVFLFASGPLKFIAALGRRLRLRRHRSVLLLAVSRAALGVTAATQSLPPDAIQPDRPGIADGSTVIGPKRFQIEAGVQRQDQRSNHQSQHVLFTPTLLRYGLDNRWELRLESNGYTQAHVSGSGRTSGYSPVSLGAKYHFQDAGEKNGNLSLGVILRVFAPSGSSDFRTHHLTTDFRLAADWTLAPDWALNPNVGVALYEDDTGKSFAAGLMAVTLTYNPNKRLQPYLDVGLQSPEGATSKTAVLFDGGATYLLDANTQVDFGIGPGLRGRTAPDLFWTVGISRRFHAK